MLPQLKVFKNVSCKTHHALLLLLRWDQYPSEILFPFHILTSCLSNKFLGPINVKWSAHSKHKCVIPGYDRATAILVCVVSHCDSWAEYLSWPHDEISLAFSEEGKPLCDPGQHAPQHIFRHFLVFEVSVLEVLTSLGSVVYKFENRSVTHFHRLYCCVWCLLHFLAFLTTCHFRI